MRTGALVVGIAALTPTASVGCGGTTHSATTKHASVSSIASSGTSASHVPNPFKIVARYSASSLGLRDPRGLAIGPNGNLYITDATDRVTEVSSTGKMLRRWGGRGTRPGQFDFAIQGSGDPTSLAVGIAAGPNGDVYVSDSGNERVEVFSPTGHFIRQFGSSITGASGHFLQPNALVVDPRGNVYVTDDEQNVVEKYSPSGSFLWQVGSGAGSSDPDLSGFLTLASIDRHGLLPIASDSGAIVYLDAQGHKVDAFHTTAYLPHGVGPCDVTLDSQGDAFVQSCGPYALVFNRTHNLIAAWHHAPFPALSPRFGPRGAVFALGYQRGVVCNGCAPNVILKLKVALPGV